MVPESFPQVEAPDESGISKDIWANVQTTNTSYKYCDAYLWIKIPGESDGKCNGGPKAGRFWGEQAEELVKNSEFLNI